jgi:hypothetical protein
MQDVGDIDKDIESASLKHLAAQSRLNSALTSVYAKSAAPQQGDPTPEDTISQDMATSMQPENGLPAGSSDAKAEAAGKAPLAAQVHDASAPAQQRLGSRARPAPHKQAAVQNIADAGTQEAAQEPLAGESAPLEPDAINLLSW